MRLDRKRVGSQCWSHWWKMPYDLKIGKDVGINAWRHTLRNLKWLRSQFATYFKFPLILITSIIYVDDDYVVRLLGHKLKYYVLISNEYLDKIWRRSTIVYINLLNKTRFRISFNVFLRRTDFIRQMLTSSKSYIWNILFLMISQKK